MRLSGFTWLAIVFSAVVIVFSSAVLWVGMDQQKKDDQRGQAERERESGVFYEIFVRSFYDSNGDGIGDLAGVTEKLDYLEGLGISGIWLTPVHPSPSYHGYDVTDYYAINPDFGTMADFERLVAEAHKRNIRVIMDFVVNHTSNKHPWFVESAQGTGSKKRDWYVWAGEGANTNTASATGEKAWHPLLGGQYLGIFWEGMPDLNLDNPEVRAEMIRIGQFWLNKGVDGFRLDAAKHIYEDFQGQARQKAISDKNVAWWQEFRAGLNEVNPVAYLVGEVWDAPSVIGPYLDRAFTASFNFDLAGQLLAAAGSESGFDVAFTLGRVHGYYAQVSGGAFEDALFLTNHDQNRVMSQLLGNVDHAKMAAAMLLTLPGRPYIYYGEEIGMQGVKPDERIREPMVWSRGAGAEGGVSVEAQESDPDSLLEHYKKLIHLRKKVPSLTSGAIESFPVPDAGVMAYVRGDGDERVLVLHNLTADAKSVDLADGSGGGFQRIVFDSTGSGKLDDSTVTIPGYTTMVLE